MHVASLELCKELYELSGWGRMDNTSSTDHYYRSSWITVKTGEPDVMRNWKIEPWESFNEVARLHCSLNKGHAVPAYDLGYLLRKLPYGFTIVTRFNDGWLASWAERSNAPDVAVEGDTPENATAELCIELFKNGTLTKA